MITESEIHVCGACTSVVDSIAERCGWCGRPSPTAGWGPNKHDEWLGRDLGGYHVVQRLHRDDSVYRAETDSMHSFEVQIFRLDHLSTRSNWVARLDRVRRIASPRYFVNILKAWEIDDAGILLYSPTRGMPLSAWRERENAVDPALALELCRQLLCGLVPLHRAGMYHGALHPNALTVSLDRTEVLCIVTLGKTIGLPAARVHTGFRPERESGSPADDVHAVGAVLFWLMTGTEPSGGVLGADPRRLLKHWPSLQKIVSQYTQEGRPATAALALAGVEAALAVAGRRRAVSGAYVTPTPVDSREVPSSELLDPVSGEVFAFEDPREP